jgi:hypothetical protein
VVNICTPRFTFKTYICPQNIVLHQDLHAYMITLHSIFLRMRNVSYRTCTEMFHTELVQKCFIQNLYGNVSYRTCTEMFHTELVQKCFIQNLFRNVSYRTCTEMFHTELVQNTKTHILCSVTFFFRKSRRLRDNVEKYCRAGQATDGNMAHAHCMLDT